MPGPDVSPDPHRTAVLGRTALAGHRAALAGHRAALAGRRAVARSIAWALAIRPPIGNPRFWIVQAGILVMVVLHAASIELPAHDLGGMPAPITASLLLIPVIYAALNFGVRGAVGTSLSCTAVIGVHWLMVARLTATHFWIEASFLIVLNTVAIVVGQRVESEQRARLRAESALRTARHAEFRYHSLFEDQPAPVIITDCAGTVTEINTAAAALFGPAVPGCPLDQLLGIGTARLLSGEAFCLGLPLADPSPRLYVPTAHQLLSENRTRLVQVVLTDVTEQHRRQDEQRRFAARLLTVQEDERRSLARELHDDPLQDLTYLTRVLEDLSQHPNLPGTLGDQLKQTSTVAGDAATALRKIIHGLRPPVLDDLGLVSALRQLADEARQRSGLAIEFRVSGTGVRLPPEFELAAYRIAQESLTNVIRHAGASQARMHLRFGDSLVLTVTDDGVGIDAGGNNGTEAGGGLGLIGMRERVSMAGGTLTIKPRSPHGTRVRATLPFLPARSGAPAGAERSSA